MRALVLGLATAIVVVACPAVASATDYCVGPDNDCGGTPALTFDTALQLAAQVDGADRIFLAGTEYVAQTGTGFTYNVAGSPIEIIGKGRGQTTLTSPPGASWVLNLSGGSSVRDLTIRIPQNAAPGATGLSTDKSARRIDVVEDQTQMAPHQGVVLGGDAPLEDSTVTLGGAQNTSAVVFGPGGGSVRRSDLTAWQGVESNYGGLVEGSRVTGVKAGVYGIRGYTTITGTLIRFSGAGGGIAALSGSGAPTSVRADGVTIVGPGLAGSVGAGATSGGVAPDSAELILTNSIIRGVASSLWVFGGGRFGGDAKVRTSYSDYDPSGNVTSEGTVTESSISYVGDAGFVDPAAGDYHLSSGSPLLDRGDPGTLPGLDLDGNPLVTDGDGDGLARRDMGAFEHAAVPLRGPAGSAGGAADSTRPLISGFRAVPSVFAVARGTRLRYTLSEAARVTIAIQRNLPGRRSGGRCVRPSPRLQHAKRCVRHGTVGTLKGSAVNGANRMRFTGRIAKRALRPGGYRAVIRATDAAGNRSAPKSARLRVTR